jgi:hypothetical protein
MITEKRELSDRIREAKNVNQIINEVSLEKSWKYDLQINRELQTGVAAGLTFEEYQARSGCPHTLRSQYYAMQQSSGIAPHSVDREDPFVTGFRTGQF